MQTVNSFSSDYALPQVAKLSKTLQAEKLDLTIISSLVDATLHTLDDALLPAANWVLELLDIKESLEEVADIKITMPDIESFQKTVFHLYFERQHFQSFHFPRCGVCFQHF